MRLKLGIWAGGDPSNAPGTIEWAGGKTDYAAGPYTMYIKSAIVENMHPSKTYTYTDDTGEWQSIDFDGKDGETPEETITSKTTTTRHSSTTVRPSTTASSPKTTGPSGSASSTSAAGSSTPTPTLFLGAASAPSTSTISRLALLGLFTAMLQL
ncbi:uncharacterized protein CDV56_100891 [Aspergillus thermomutatus]|uniref:GH16 domain-containing protein n=1 Tax=Aspergillus thermomutatus TaxID=41047 RepID=A0A397G4J0_ASPTH|nr:uncharacterized protein CDV56_100891 [Aspergillus thermomutatus]RHZ43070.1 hypothetical protein CDV56_100891 [Aspergillus thermomutatus]